jgi:winged helix DNA-binding protein
VFGVQAQDRRAAMLAVRARTEGATAETVEAALSGAALVRTWAMRGTLHLLAAEDLPTALAIFGPLHLARGRRRLTELGLGPDDIEGVLVEVAENLYGPLDVTLPDREAALVELARRYAAGHAPATAEDFAKWSGLPARDIRWEEATAGEAEEGGVRLLPAFDEWLLGWASRDPILPREHAKKVVPGGGIIRPVAIADGRVFATWRLDRPKRRIELQPFGRVTRAMRAGVEEEVAAIGDFLGLCLALKA